jgi:hypothetical protein
MSHVTSHNMEVSLAYECSARDVCAFSDRLERQGRIAIIDDAIRDVKAHFLGLIGGDGGVASSSWGISDHTAAAKSVKQRRMKQLEDTNNLLQRKYEAVRLERDHFANSLSAVERKVLDGVRSLSDAAKLRAENAKLHAAVQKLTSTRSTVRNQTSQTIDHELEVVTLRRQSRQIQCYNLALLEQLGRADVASDFVESVHRLHEVFLQIKHQDRNLAIKRLQKGAASVGLENQMLHEELSLCLRRIATLEAAHGIVAQREDSSMSDREQALRCNTETQTVEDSATIDRLLADVAVLDLDNRKLRMLLTKFVGVVAAEVVK